MSDLNEYADAFLRLFRTLGLDPHPGLSLSDLSLEEAYEVQRRVIQSRVDAGEAVAGYKVGCTSRAIRRQFGLSEPICGNVMFPHVIESSAVLNWNDYHCPAVEPEFVIQIGRDLADEVGPQESLVDAVEFISPGIEVHHFDWWFGEPTMQELVCSNGIHASVVIGASKVAPDSFDWELEGVGIFKNGKLADSGIGAEIMGGPMHALRWLVNHLVRRGETLKAGQIVIPGSAVSLIRVEENDVLTARFTHLGSARAEFKA
ncbi:MAG: hypothetical protein AAFU85_15870 [Planctomycetota bacterium]